MKKTIVFAVVAAALLSGCAPRYQSEHEREMNRAAILGAAESQALQNAHDAAFGQGVYREQEHRDSARHHHHHHADQYGQSAKKPVTLKSAVADATGVTNAPISEAAEFLLSQGWKPNEGVWHKGKYIMKLVVEDNIVVNAQVQ